MRRKLYSKKMKLLKIIIPVITLIFAGVQKVNAQEISRENKKQIKAQEEEIRVNEEMLMSGVKGLEKIKSRLERNKSKNKVTKKEVARKERIIRNVEQRLNKLNKKIEKQKVALNNFKKSLNIVVKEEEKIVAVGGVQQKIDENKVKDIQEREQKLKAAKEKLEREIKESEAAYLKKQEELRQKNLELAKLDNQLEKEKKQASGGLSEEVKQKILEYEDEISMSSEMLASGREDLNKMKEKVDTAAKEGTLSKVGLKRRRSIIRKMGKRLNKIEKKIQKKKEEIQKLRGM